MEAPVITARDVDLTFQTADGPVHALKGVNLDIAKGEFVSFIGPSGCGKTTFLRVVAALETPTAGKVTVNGLSPDEARRARAYGYVFQAAGLYPWRTIGGNIKLPLEIMGFSKAEQARRVREVLELVELGGFEKKFPWQLSGGMQQRASIARALAFDADILLMDEPFGALDPDTREQMQLFLLELWEEQGTTIFFVTHDLEEAVFVGTRILVLSYYYTDDRGDGFARGSRIVSDHQLARIASATAVKHDPRFVALMEELRRDGFDPAHLQHAAEFNLRHPDSFQTLTDDVHGRAD